MRDEFRQRHDFFYAGIRRLPGFACVPASGTFYLFPNIEAAIRAKRVGSDTEFCERLLEEVGLALVPGTAFGARGHVRLSFAASIATLTAALERLDDFLAA
jgi:aspartate aminotransferase